MHVVAFVNTKGGTGKTSLAAHLAVAAEATGTRTVLLDADPQGSLADWWKARAGDTPALTAGTLEELPSKLQALREAGFRLAIIDTPGAATPALSALVGVASLVLVPVRPSPNDLRALGPTLGLLKVAGRPFRFVLNGVNPRGRLTLQAAAALSEHGPVAPVFLAARTDLVASMTDGRTALETAPGSPAATEVRSLWTYVRTQLKKGA